jgi:hypothetical protein
LQQYSQSESSGEKRKLQAIAGSDDPASSTKVAKKAKLGVPLEQSKGKGADKGEIVRKARGASPYYTIKEL